MSEVRLMVRMGRTSFGCDPADLDRLVAWHRPLAERLGWDGTVTTQEIKVWVSRGQGAADKDHRRKMHLAAMAARRQANIEKWTRILAVAETRVEAARMGNVTKTSVDEVIRKYGLMPRWPARVNALRAGGKPKCIETRNEAYRKRLEPYLDGTWTRAEAAKALGVSERHLRKVSAWLDVRHLFKAPEPGGDRGLRAQLRRS